jgi:hypothetical protein
MCMACEMEAMWFAAMETRARALAADAGGADAAVETVAQGEIPLAEGGRDGEGVMGVMPSAPAGGTEGKSAEPLPNAHPEEGTGEALRAIRRVDRSAKPSSRFSCEETQAE